MTGLALGLALGVPKWTGNVSIERCSFSSPQFQKFKNSKRRYERYDRRADSRMSFFSSFVSFFYFL